MTPQQCILGLDIGTSGVRAALFAPDGGTIPDTLVESERSVESTIAEIDPEYALKHFIAVIDDVDKIAKRAGLVVAYVGSCAFWHSLVGVDTHGVPTTPVVTWADTRARAQTLRLKRRFDEETVRQRTGAHFHSSFWPAKLLWFQEHSRKETALWLSFSEFIALRLLGVAATSPSMASGTGLFDIRRGRWDEKILRFVGVRSDQLPLVAEGRYTFRLIEKYRRRWPRLKNAEWFPAIGDGAASNIGSGCLKRHRGALTVGTSAAMRVAYSGPPPESTPAGLWAYLIDPGRVVLGGALSDAGNLYRWLTDNLKPGPGVEAAIALRPPASHGLTVLPFVHGERSTGYNEHASGSVIGVRSSTDVPDLIQATMESVAFRVAEILDRLNSVVRIRDLYASGGALRESSIWAQIFADVLGRDLTLIDERQTSLRGAALLALETTGRIGKLDDAPTPGGKIIKADRSRKPVYAAARKRHQHAYRLFTQLDD